MRRFPQLMSTVVQITGLCSRLADFILNILFAYRRRSNQLGWFVSHVPTSTRSKAGVNRGSCAVTPNVHPFAAGVLGWLMARPLLQTSRWISHTDCRRRDICERDRARAQHRSLADRYARSDEGAGRNPGAHADDDRLGRQLEARIVDVVRSRAKDRVLRRDRVAPERDRRHRVAIDAGAETGVGVQGEMARIPDAHARIDARAASDASAERPQREQPPGTQKRRRPRRRREPRNGPQCAIGAIAQ